MTKFHPHAPVSKYLQYYTNTCSFSSLASEMYDDGECVTEKAIASCIYKSLIFESNGYVDIIRFDNAIMVDKKKNKGEQCRRYNLLQ